MDEPFSSISHMVGGALSVAGLVLLVVWAEGALAVTAAAIYGVGLIAAYTLSSTYHAFPKDSAAKPWMRRLDHVAIYLLIAGTYTPVVLVAFGGAWGWSLFGVVWGLATVGIVLKLTTDMGRRWIYTVSYIGLGWIAVVAAPVLVRIFSLEALAWLLAGGLLYTVGAVVYLLHKEGHQRAVSAHDIWHLFVLAGSASHFVFVAGYVI